MQKDRPIINNISLIVDDEWITRTFLPLFDDLLLWAEGVKCGDCCPLACYCHPMVADEHQQHLYHKLCTLTVIRAGLVTRKEIIGVGGKQHDA